MKYLDCPVTLWVERHRPDLEPPRTPDVEQRLAMGREVDDYSRKLFNGGVEVAGYNHEGARNTRKLVAEGEKILFQPTAVAGNITCRADILEKSGNVWVLNEVKSATTVKKEYPYDVAFQRICFEAAGIKIGKTNLIHINNRYVRQGALEPEKLFAIEDITEEADAAVEEVRAAIPKALEVLERTAAPDEEMIKACRNPKSCGHLQNYLASIGQKLELPEIEELTDKAGIQAAFSELVYPLYFLDYETYGSALPPFDGTRPYQNIPFQYALGIKDTPDSPARYTEFLAQKFLNPVLALLAQLKNDLRGVGTIIVWNRSFEMGRNEEMAEMFPEYAGFLKDVNSRVFDLMLIFKIKNQLYTRNAFEMSASLKNVLPVICPELAYGDLAIQEGSTASASWPKLTGDALAEKEREKLADDMRKYCKRDVEAMVCILEKIQKETR